MFQSVKKTYNIIINAVYKNKHPPPRCTLLISKPMQLINRRTQHDIQRALLFGLHVPLKVRNTSCNLTRKHVVVLQPTLRTLCEHSLSLYIINLFSKRTTMSIHGRAPLDPQGYNILK